MLRLPGLIDPHVHLREPGGTHKRIGTRARPRLLAGGFTTVLAMPNAWPPITGRRPSSLRSVPPPRRPAATMLSSWVCGADNGASAPVLAPSVAGPKMYLDQTYGPLRLDALSDWQAHFARWPRTGPSSHTRRTARLQP